MSATSSTTSSSIRPQPTSCVVGSEDLVVPGRDGSVPWAPNANVVGIAGNDVNNEAFKACCKGPVNFAPPCALWCEIEPRPLIVSELEECWKSHGLTVEAQFGEVGMNGTTGQGIQLASSSITAPTTATQTTIPVAAGNTVYVNFGVATAALIMVVKHLIF